MNARSVEAKLTASRVQHEIASSILKGRGRFETCPYKPGECQADGGGIGPWGDDEIVFHLPPGAVVEQVYAGIHILIAHLGVSGDVGVPPGGVAAEEVMALARQFILPGDAGVGISTNEVHAEHGCGLRIRDWGLGDKS